jgi:hypothetical protein
MNVVCEKVLLGALIIAAVTGCTPEHTVRAGEDIAARTRLKDSVAIHRSNDRLLSRQAQICLVSDSAATEQGALLLHNMQAALSGYFLAVGVESQALDFASAMRQLPCPGVNYVLYVQPIETPCKTGAAFCHDGRITDLLITILNADNSGVADRITVTLNRSWLSMATDAQADQRDVFEQLARALTGTATP